MRQILVCVVLSLITSSALAAKVTIVNSTPMPIYVRCIAPGSVPVENEYSKTIAPDKRHSRSDFEPGLRVVAAWTTDGKRCAAIPTRITDGMELVVRYDKDSDEISFEAPCSACASGSSENEH